MTHLTARILTLVAAFALSGAVTPAVAQEPKPRALETALIGPASVMIPGIGTRDGVLSAADTERYRRVFELQEDAQWRAADAIIRRIEDRRLLGHVLAQRYLHPTAYRSRFDELRDWLTDYADHPQARRIHRLAVLRQPKGARAPAAPVVHQNGIPGTGVVKSHEGRPLFSRAASRPGYDLQSEIRRRVANGWPTGARDLLNSHRAGKLLAPAQIAQAWRAIAQGYFRAGKDTDALNAALAAHAVAPGEAPLAYWWGGLSAWRLGELDKAQQLFGELSRARRAADSLVAAGSFWASRAALANGHLPAVTRFLQNGAAHPRTFYGLLSRRALGDADPIEWRQPVFRTSAFEDIADTGIGARAVALMQVGRDYDAERELLSLAAAKPELRQDVLALATHAGLPAVALKLSWYASEDVRDTASYPIPAWEPEGGYRIDRALVLAFVRQESRFDRRAESRAGARGLMQLMPRTASYVGGEQNLRGRGKYRLYEPDLNLELGQRYIQYLLEHPRISGDLLRLVAAYNAGPGNLSAWERAFEHGDDPLLFIESLPARETRRFVEQILTNFWIYRSRLGQEAPSLDALVAGRWPTYEPQERHGR